jgi:hypothetical protein
MDINHHLLPGDGYKIPAILIQPAKPLGAAVIVHGYGGNKEEQLGLGWRVANAGLVACIIDLRGHGEHPLSLDGDIGADLDAAIRFCRFFGEVTVIGHSLSGLLALLSNAAYRIAVSPPLSRTFNKHMQETLIAHRSYRVRSFDPAYIFAILKELPVWDPTQDIENTLVLFAEWDIPEIVSSCIAIKKVGAHVVQIPKSMHNDIFLVEKTFEDVQNKVIEWYDKGE